MKSLPSWRVSKKSDFRRSKIFFLNSNSGFLDDLRCQYQSSQEESLYRSSPRARSPIAKKIWFPIHPRNFDSYVTVRPPTRPPARLSAPQENQCEMWHFLASVGACNLILHIHVVVKTCYRWRPYRGLSCRTIEDTCFFCFFTLPLTSF